MRPTYVVCPRPGGDGYALSGPSLPWALWYLDSPAAVDHAFSLLRFSGGRVVVLNASGEVAHWESVGSTPDRSHAGAGP